MEFDKKMIGITILFIALIGSVSYNVFEVGEELVCRTNKPNGWEIIEEYDNFVKAECPYITKDPLIAYCKSFRSTPSYLRYGCEEIFLVQLKEDINSNQEICNQEECIKQEVD